MGLAAFVFAALASALGHSLKVLAVSKARAQGNEVATQGIEDLQRLGYSALGVCQPAPAPPVGLSDVATPLNCPNPVPAGYGEDPCNAATSGAGVPKATYACTRVNVTYDVRRYVAWGDPARRSKRMAVFVTWTDSVGFHEVSQQSSLRAPGQADVFGLDPPQFAGPVTVTSNLTVIDAGGTLPSGRTVQLHADTLNLTTADQVLAIFNTLDADNNQITSSKFLTSADGNNWNATISSADGFRFATGTMFFGFSAVRADDGKANSAFPSDTNRFCAPPDESCSLSQYPEFSSVPEAQPSSDGPHIGVDAAGTILPDRIELTASTRNTAPSDRVTVSFQTTAGAVTVLLASTSPSCDPTTTCTWSGSVSKGSGYSFPVGTSRFYFAVTQVRPDAKGVIVPGGATGARASADKTFVLR